MKETVSLFNDMTLQQDGRWQKLGLDSILLADFATVGKAQRVVDAGAGVGVVSLLLAGAHPTCRIDAIEIEEEAADLMEENIRANGLQDRVRVFRGDLTAPPADWPSEKADLLVSNPPYFEKNRGKTAEGARGAARSDEKCTLDGLMAFTAKTLRYRGRAAFVYRPERLSALFAAMLSVHIEPKRLRMVQNLPSSAPSLVLVEGMLGGAPGLKIESPLILRDENGNDSGEIRRIYHSEGERA